MPTYNFPDPATLTLQDNYSVTEILELPPLVHCTWKAKSCEETWHKVKCINDSDYLQPYIAGDRIIIQTQFLDYQNIPDDFRCPPPLKKGKAIAQIRLIDNPLVVYGDANNNILWNNEFNPPSDCGTVGQPVYAGAYPALMTKNYTNFADYREGTLNFWTTYPLNTNPIVTRISVDTLQFEYDIEAFTKARGVSPCHSVYLDCFRKDDHVNWIQLSSSDPTAPKTETVFPFTCCPDDPPCLGLATVETGCSIPSDKARTRFQIVPSGSYVFGTANQATADVSDVGLMIVKESEPCPSWNTVIDPLLLFSQATNFANYITRVSTWIQANLMLPGDTITANTTTGEFEIIFDKVNHQDNGWSVCADRLKFCEVRFDAGVSCTFTSDLKEISFIIDHFDAGTGTLDAGFYASDGTFSYSVSSVPITSLNAFLLFIVNDFNTNALGNSYAVPFSGVPNDVNPQGFNGIKFHLDTTQYANVCENRDWRLFISGETTNLVSRIYETDICCDKGCNENEQGYSSFDFYVPNPSIIDFSDAVTLFFLYDCANTLPATAFGSSTLVPPALNWDSFLLNLVDTLNRPAVISAMSLPVGTYAQLFGHNIRLKIPLAGLPSVTCVTNKEFNLSLTLTDVGLATFTWQVENRHWCASSCATSPPEQHKITIDILDDPSYEFGNPDNNAWLYVLHNQLDCEGLTPPGYPTFADATDLQEYVEQLQRWLLDYFRDFGGKNSFILKQIGSDWQIIGYIDRYAYRFATSGYDPCEGMKLCLDNVAISSPSSCHHELEYVINSVTPPSIVTTYDVRLQFICGALTYGFVQNIAISPTETVASLTNKIYLAFQFAYPTWIVTLTASNRIKFQIPCNDPILVGNSCGCVGGFLGTNVGIDIYLGGQGGGGITMPSGFPISNIAVNRAYSYVGCVIAGGDSPTPFIINAILTNDNSCCTVCYNPLDYINLKVKITDTSITSFKININSGGRGCSSGTVLDISTTILESNTEIACQKLSNLINTRQYGDVFSRADGDVLLIWVLVACDCEPEDFVDVFINEGILQQLKPYDCCPGSGTPATQQTIQTIITENNACCDDYFINIQLVDCCCNPITGLTYVPPCDHTGQAQAIFDLTGQDLAGKFVSLSSLEDSSYCFSISPFEIPFDNLSSYESQLQNWVDEINTNGNPDVIASRDGLKLILTWNTIIDGCCISNLVWNIGGVDQTPVLVDCCAGTPVPFSIFDAVEGWIVGQNRDLHLEFFQNIKINPNLIPVDCFMIRINDNRGNVHFSECYQKEKCLPTILLCSEYAEGKKDCQGNIYGLPEFGCPAVIEPIYSNCVRVRGEFFEEKIEYATDGKKRTSTKTYRLRTELLPPYMIEKIDAVLGGKNITINGIPVEFDDSINKEREVGKMWAVSALFKAIACVNDETCD